jgi:hypothetical protein
MPCLPHPGRCYVACIEPVSISEPRAAVDWLDDWLVGVGRSYTYLVVDFSPKVCACTFVPEVRCCNTRFGGEVTRLNHNPDFTCRMSNAIDHGLSIRQVR